MEEISAQLRSRSFASDNNSGVIPEAIAVLLEVNKNHVGAYGNDSVTLKTKDLFKEVFGSSCDPYFVFNGTAANNLCLTPFVKPFEAVICSEHAHIHQNECGAPERLLGIKLQPLKTQDGKLDAQQIKTHLKTQRYGDIHSIQPRMVSITQPTELGTVYSIKEMQDISAVAKEHGLFLHIDGSRLVNAAMALNKSLKEITVDVGADCISFGGTKNGLMLAEAALFFNSYHQKDIPFYQKQLLQLPGKSRFVAAQFYALLKNNLWKKYARHANQMAQKLALQLKPLKQVKIIQPVESNAIFAQIPRASLKKARARFFFYLWEDSDRISPNDTHDTPYCVVRWMSTFDTTQEDIDAFCLDISNSLKESL